MYINEDRFSKKVLLAITDEILSKHNNNPDEALRFTKSVLEDDGLKLSKETKENLKQVVDMLSNKVQETKTKTFKQIANEVKSNFSLDEGLFDKFKKPTITSKLVDPNDEKVAKLLNEPIFDDTFEAKLVVYPPFKKEPDMITVMDARALSDPKIQNAYHILRKRYPKSPIRLYSERGNKTFYENSKALYEIEVKNKNHSEYYNAGQLDLAFAMTENLYQDKTLSDAVFTIIDKANNKPVAEYTKGNWRTTLTEDSLGDIARTMATNGIAFGLGLDPAVMHTVTDPMLDKVIRDLKRKLNNKTSEKEALLKLLEVKDPEYKAWKKSDPFIAGIFDQVKKEIIKHVPKKKQKLAYAQFNWMFYEVVYKEHKSDSHEVIAKIAKKLLKTSIESVSEAADDNRKPKTFVRDAEIIGKRDFIDLNERKAYADSGLHPALDDFRAPKWIIKGYENYFDENAHETYPQMFKLDGISKEQIQDENGKYIAKAVYLRPYIQKDPEGYFSTKLNKFLAVPVEVFKDIMHAQENAETLAKFEKAHPDSPEEAFETEQALANVIAEEYPEWEKEYWDTYNLEDYDAFDRGLIYLAHKDNKGNDLNPADITMLLKLKQPPKEAINHNEQIIQLFRNHKNGKNVPEDILNNARIEHIRQMLWKPMKYNGVKEIFDAVSQSIKSYPALQAEFTKSLYEWYKDAGNRNQNSISNILMKFNDKVAPFKFAKLYDTYSNGKLTTLKNKLKDNRYGEDISDKLDEKIAELSGKYDIKDIKQNINNITKEFNEWLTNISPYEIKWEHSVNKATDGLLEKIRLAASGKDVLTQNMDLISELNDFIKQLTSEKNVDTIKQEILKWSNENLPKNFNWVMNAPEEYKKTINSIKNMKNPDGEHVANVISRLQQNSPDYDNLTNSLNAFYNNRKFETQLAELNPIFKKLQKSVLDPEYLKGLSDKMAEITTGDTLRKLPLEIYYKYGNHMTPAEIENTLSELENKKQTDLLSSEENQQYFGLQKILQNPKEFVKHNELSAYIDMGKDFVIQGTKEKNSPEECETLEELEVFLRNKYKNKQHSYNKAGKAGLHWMYKDDDARKEYNAIKKQWLTDHGMTADSKPRTFRDKLLNRVLTGN